MKKTAWALALVTVAFAVAPAGASADLDDWTEVPGHVPSPENFGIEFRVGAYYPALGDSFTEFFGNDIGPMLALEFDFYPWRIPYVGLLGAGLSLGWSAWDAQARDENGLPVEESTGFELIPMALMAVLRVDALPRNFNVPIVLTGKFGLDLNYWSTSTGGQTRADGWSLGLRFAGKVSLELDFIEPRAARQLDEEWGINHTELFFEVFGSTAGQLVSGQLPVGGWGWAAGLGFTF